jgi:transposase
MVHSKRGTEAMRAMGVLPAFAGVAVHGAWAPYDTYTGSDHQLFCAHALRELQAVTDAAPGGQWCWAAQAAEALTAMQDLVREAAGQSRRAVDPAALAAQIRLYRSAVLPGPARPRPAPGRCGKSTMRWPGA